ncbi:MAG: hypothetical protein QG588_2058 [Candidatus Poribacteria bacterium]|nr:hypothetical protein [Candidatus Poribacteria bacterium]
MIRLITKIPVEERQPSIKPFGNVIVHNRFLLINHGSEFVTESVSYADAQRHFIFQQY